MGLLSELFEKCLGVKSPTGATGGGLCRDTLAALDQWLCGVLPGRCDSNNHISGVSFLLESIKG